MTDKEMLEMAAKAAGIRIFEWDQFPDGEYALTDADANAKWNPLKDDGDAFRLAVKCGINLYSSDGDGTMRAECFGDWFAEDVEDGDEDKAMRRAIVRAAAEIGKGK